MAAPRQHSSRRSSRRSSRQSSRSFRRLVHETLEDRRLLTCNHVVLDAGHGGSTTVGGSSPNNATSVSGLLEKDLTLQLANALKPLLEARGFDVTMTRTSDVNLGLADRAAVAANLIEEETDHIFFLSIHFNGFNDASVRGTETLIDSTGNVNAGQDQIFASAIQQAALAPWLAEGGRNRGVKSQGLGVLDDASLGNTADEHPVVAALLEAEFITNADVDAVLTSQATFLGQLAASVADGFVEARRQLCKPTDLVFAIDTTGSMEDDIDAVKARAGELVDTLFEQAPDSRVGIVIYRDHGDAFVAQTQQAFTDDRDAILSSINSITVDGGGDFPEAVYSGLLHAIRAQGGLGDWRQEEPVRKVIVQMGDAPAHDPEPVTGYTLATVTAEAMAGGVMIGEPQPEAGGEAGGEAEALEPLQTSTAIGSSMTNPVSRVDVNGDGHLSIADVQAAFQAVLLSAGADRLETEVQLYPDTTGDGWLTPEDVLLPFQAVLQDLDGPVIDADVIAGPVDFVVGSLTDVSGIDSLTVVSGSAELATVSVSANGEFAFEAESLLGRQSVAGLRLVATDTLGNRSEAALSSDRDEGDSGGETDGPSRSLLDMLAAEQQHDGTVTPISIYSIVIGGDPDALQSLSAIAQANGGEVFEAEDADDVVDALLNVLDVVTGEGDPPVIDSIDSSALIAGQTSPGQTVEVTGTFSDGDLSGDYTAMVDWGDGNLTPADVSVNGVGEFSAEHTYQAGGAYTISVVVSDEDGDSEAATTTALITGARLSDGQLSIVGTSGHNYVYLAELFNGDIRLFSDVVHGHLKIYDGDEVDSVQAHLGAGFDIFHVLPWWQLPVMVDGGEGNDSIWTGDGDDLIAGGPGNDFIFSQGGDDMIDAGAGRDGVWAGEGHDNVLGGPGRDVIFGQGGHDNLLGGLDDDILFGGLGDDLLRGGDGRDVLFGEWGDDTLRGDAGFDIGVGGPGDDDVEAEQVY